MIKCVIIDDEPLARECIAGYTADVDFLELVGMGNNPLDLAQLIKTQSPDLVFLDIQMPLMNGIDFLKTSTDLPLVIITTAYPSYALESFQLDVMDYLVKPITFSRFFMAVNKVRDYHALLNRSGDKASLTGTSPDYFFIKCGNKFERIFFNDILFVEAMQNYVVIHTTRGKYTTLLPLKTVEQNLSTQSFIRVHKSYIVATDKIEAIDNHEIIIQSKRVPISRQYRELVLEQVVNARLWKK